jgi:hypothetical protein
MARDVLTEIHGEEIGLDDDRALVIKSGIIRAKDGSPVSFPDGVTGVVSGGAAGSSGNLQYNASGAFAAMSGTTWNDTTRALRIDGATVTSAADAALYVGRTWNSAEGHIFARFVVTDTSSSSGARFLTCEIAGGSTVFSLRKDGAITQGSWQATAVGATFGGTGQTTWSTGDLLYASASNTTAKLGVGAANQVLTVAGGAPSWAYSYIPQNSRSADYTLQLSDGGGHVYHPSADTSARQWTIPNNGTVAFPIGTAVTFVNDTSAGTITIAMVSDTLVLAGTGSTGSRTLAANGIATAIKVTATRWMISGTGLT